MEEQEVAGSVDAVERQRRAVAVLQHNCKAALKTCDPLTATGRKIGCKMSSQTPPHFEYWNRLLVSREELLGCLDFCDHKTFFAKGEEEEAGILFRKI